jgi:hypothetical protein
VDLVVDRRLDMQGLQVKLNSRIIVKLELLTKSARNVVWDIEPRYWPLTAVRDGTLQPGR